MNTLSVRACLARSNPLIMREFTISDTRSAGDLAAACCICLGLEALPCSLSYDSDEGTVNCTPDMKLEAVFADCDRALLVITTDPGKKANNKVNVYIDLVDRCRETDADEDMPKMYRAAGFNLPAGISDIANINTIHRSLTERNSFFSGSDVYTHDDLMIKENRTENALRRHFAPLTAAKEVNAKIKAPLSFLLSNINLSDLKAMAPGCGIYLYAGAKKAEVINYFCRHYDAEFIKDFFEKLKPAEYKAFTEYILSEDPDTEDQSLEDTLITFYDYGLLTYIPKRGYCIASEVTNYYENFLDGQIGRQFYREKAFLYTMKICIDLYGVFDIKMFKAVCAVIMKDDLDEVLCEEYYTNILKNRGADLGITTKDDFICSKDMSITSLVECTRSLSSGSEYYLPSEDDIKLIDAGLRAQVDTKELVVQVRDYCGYYFVPDNLDQTIEKSLYQLHCGSEVRKVSEQFLAKIRPGFYVTADKKFRIKNNIANLFEAYSKNIPMARLHGFTQKNRPLSMKGTPATDANDLMTFLEKAANTKKGKR